MQGPITAEMTNELFSQLPIKNDIDEAQDFHKTLLEQVLKGSAVIEAFKDQVKQAVTNIKTYADANPKDDEQDILGDKGRELMQ